MKPKLLIFGTSSFAEVVYHYLKREYKIEAFISDTIYKSRFCNKDIFYPTRINEIFPPNECKIFIAIGYSDQNRTRMEVYHQIKELGYEFITYIDPKAIIGENVTIGDNCFIMELNNIQTGVRIGNNCILWAGNHIGHHSKIGSNNFISSHVVISGLNIIGRNCFFGVNSCTKDDISIMDYTTIGMGAVVTKSINESGIYVGNPARRIQKR